MKKFLMGAVGIALAGSLAFAQQETTQEETTEYGEDVGEWDEQEPATQTEPEMQDPTQAPTDDPMLGEETQTDEPATWEQESGMQQSVADMTAEELQGKSIVTETGEEVGQIDRVGQSQEHQERVVTVDVGGFLGVAEKTIALPLSELELTPDGHLKTSSTKESLEGQPEFDEQGFTEEGTEEATDPGY